MKRTRSEETSQAQDSFQDFLKTSSQMNSQIKNIAEQQAEMLDILKSLRYFRASVTLLNLSAPICLGHTSPRGHVPRMDL